MDLTLGSYRLYRLSNHLHQRKKIRMNFLLLQILLPLRKELKADFEVRI
jgi:hypothetical protein